MRRLPPPKAALVAQSCRGCYPYLDTPFERYLLFCESEDIVMLRVQQCGARAIVRRLEQAPSTIVLVLDILGLTQLVKRMPATRRTHLAMPTADQ